MTPAGASQLFIRTVVAGRNGSANLVGPPTGKALIIPSIHLWTTLTSCAGYQLYAYPVG